MSTHNSQAAEGHDSHRSIIKSTSILSLGTLASRILGFIRDVVLAHLLGTGFRADAFFVAQRIPNLLRDLVGEGATNAAVVPVLAEYKEKKSKDEFLELVNVIFWISMIILTVITLLGIWTAPLFVRLIVPGFMEDPSKLELTIKLTKLIFPYLIFIGLTAYSMGILFVHRSFIAPAFSPCLLNVAVILAAWISSAKMEEPVIGISIGVLIGGILQLAVQINPVLKAGIRFKMPKHLNHAGARKIGRLLIPRIVGSGVYQLSVLMDTFFASLSSIVGVGGISAIYYSNRIIQFPMGIFSVALASAVLPALSGMAHRNDKESIKKTVMFSLENIFFVMCPTTVALMILGEPIIRLLFQRGEFDAYSTQITSWALVFYSMGLLSFGGIKILVTAFYSLQDTKTPVKVAAGCLAINALLSMVLMFPLKVGGIALASTIAGTTDFLVLFYIFEKRLGTYNGALLRYFGKVSAAAVITAAVQWFSWYNFHTSYELIKLIFVGFGGFLLYGFICLVFKVEQAQKISKWITEFNLNPKS